MPIYAADGSIKTTTVDGSTHVGFYAADGSVNIVANDVTYRGLWHSPSGALRVNTNAPTSSGLLDASGAYWMARLLGNPRGGS